MLVKQPAATDGTPSAQATAPARATLLPAACPPADASPVPPGAATAERTFSLALPLLAELERLAAATGRSPGEIVAEALLRHLAMLADGGDRGAPPGGRPGRADEPASGAGGEDLAAEVRATLARVRDEPLASARLRATLEQIAERVDRADAAPPDHARRVAALALQLGRLAGLTGDRLLHVQIAALVHGIGKAAIPREVLRRRRPSPQEFALLRRYPLLGVELLQPIPALAPALPIVAAHQERYNGSGYPRGLRGDEIPLEARIVSLCDVYEVLVSDRPYRPAYPPERARLIIERNAGTLWDPDLVVSFLRRVLRTEAAATAPGCRHAERPV